MPLFNGTINEVLTQVIPVASWGLSSQLIYLAE